MSKTYIAADMQLFNGAAARSQKKSKDEYNKMIIERINEVVQPEDYLILLGEISVGDFQETKEILSRINAKWEVVDLNDQMMFRAKSIWEDMGASRVHSFDGFVKGTIDKKETNVIIATNQSNIQLWLGENNFIAMAESMAVKNNLLKEGEIFRKGVFNLSLSAWDFYPLDYTEIPKLIDDEVLFGEMEEF